jgi:DNA-binding HxlR family transcriptional regulator
LDLVGEWWTLLILRDAFQGLRRFSEFQKSLGMAKNILAARLRKLVEHGILEMRPASDGSAYQEYTLTDKGRSLRTVVEALREWGESHLSDDAASHPGPSGQGENAGATSRKGKPRSG